MSLDPIAADSRYLHGEDLRRGSEWARFTLTIKSVGDKGSAKAQNGRAIEGYPVTFEETEKVLVLNKINTSWAIAALGTNKRDEWVGQKITLYPAMLAECFGQKNVVCVRVFVPEGVPKSFRMDKNVGKDLTQEAG